MLLKVSQSVNESVSSDRCRRRWWPFIWLNRSKGSSLHWLLPSKACWRGVLTGGAIITATCVEYMLLLLMTATSRQWSSSSSPPSSISSADRRRRLVREWSTSPAPGACWRLPQPPKDTGTLFNGCSSMWSGVSGEGEDAAAVVVFSPGLVIRWLSLTNWHHLSALPFSQKVAFTR